MFDIFEYTIGGMCAAACSTLSITTFGVALGSGKPLVMYSWLSG